MKGFTKQPNEIKRKTLSGFSLIELMIAMSLSLVLMLGVYKVFDFQKQAFELISALNEREDNAQLAMKILSDGIRMADYWGGVDAQQVQVLQTVLSASPGACDSSWVFDLDDGVFGIEGDSFIQNLQGLPLDCLKNKDYLESSDLLVLRFGDSREYFYDSEIDNKQYQKHYFLRAQSGSAANIFQGKQSILAVQAIPDDGFQYNMLFHSSLYFLRPCQTNAIACIEGDSVLTRLILKGDRYIQEALVEGIEQLQFEYGVDDNQDKTIDHYVPANKISNWKQVLSVRFFMLVRSHFQDKTIDEKDKVYVMNSSESTAENTYKVPESHRYYPRKLYQAEVSVRNRLIN